MADYPIDSHYDSSTYAEARFDMYIKFLASFKYKKLEDRAIATIDRVGLESEKGDITILVLAKEECIF